MTKKFLGITIKPYRLSSFLIALAIVGSILFFTIVALTLKQSAG